MEGMQGFGRRHFPDLPRETTEFVCLECVGSPLPVRGGGGGDAAHARLPRGGPREALARAGDAAGVPLRRGLADRGGHRRPDRAARGLSDVSTLGAVDETKFPSNYHWPIDMPDNLSWESVEGARRVCEAYVRLGATR